MAAIEKMFQKEKKKEPVFNNPLAQKILDKKKTQAASSSFDLSKRDNSSSPKFNLHQESVMSKSSLRYDDGTGLRLESSLKELLG